MDVDEAAALDVLGVRPAGPTPLGRRVRVGEVEEEGRHGVSMDLGILLFSARMTRGWKVESVDDDEKERAVDLVGDRPGMARLVVLILARLAGPGIDHGPVLSLWGRAMSDSMLRAEVDGVERGMGTLGDLPCDMIVVQSCVTHYRDRLRVLTMDPSLKIVPAHELKSASVNNHTTNSFGLHDTLQYGVRSIAQEVKSDSSIRQRLESVSSSFTFFLRDNVDAWPAVGGNTG